MVIRGKSAGSVLRFGTLRVCAGICCSASSARSARIFAVSEHQSEHREREQGVVARQPLGLLPDEPALEALVFLAEQHVELLVLVALVPKLVTLVLDGRDAGQQLSKHRFCRTLVVILDENRRSTPRSASRQSRWFRSLVALAIYAPSGANTCASSRAPPCREPTSSMSACAR